MKTKQISNSTKCVKWDANSSEALFVSSPIPHSSFCPRFLLSYFFFFFFSFLGAPRHMEFLGIRSEPCFHLCCSCSNAGFFLTHCARLGIKPVSWCCRDAANLIEPQQAQWDWASIPDYYLRLYVTISDHMFIILFVALPPKHF